MQFLLFHTPSRNGTLPTILLRILAKKCSSNAEKYTRKILFHQPQRKQHFLEKPHSRWMEFAIWEVHIQRMQQITALSVNGITWLRKNRKKSEIVQREMCYRHCRDFDNCLFHGTEILQISSQQQNNWLLIHLEGNFDFFLTSSNNSSVSVIAY